MGIDPPVNPRLKIYVFNFTNPDEFLTGAKPKFEELGPYVFSDEWEKTDIEWKDNDESIEYNQLRYFKFLPNESVGRLRDQVTIPNIPMISALNAMKFGSPLVRRALGSVLNVLKQDQFISSTVRKVLFGISNPLLKLGNDVLPEEKKYPFPLFGLFVGRNGTSRREAKLTAKTGIKDRKETGQLYKFKGESKLDWWSGDYCNQITGTDGFVYRPKVEKSDTLYIFNRDLCRSLPLEFHSEMTDSNGIPGYRFVPPSHGFGTPEENPDNKCFCNSPDGCNVPSGVFNVSICQFNSPIMLSWPHFFQADPKLVEAVEGLEPRQDRHQFHIDILPAMGVGMRAAVTSQINLVMESNQHVQQLKGVRDMIFPVMWFQDGLDELTDKETVSLLKMAVQTPETARS